MSRKTSANRAQQECDRWLKIKESDYYRLLEKAHNATISESIFQPAQHHHRQKQYRPRGQKPRNTHFDAHKHFANYQSRFPAKFSQQ